MFTKLLAVSNNFPTAKFPEKGVFVANFLAALADCGVDIDVIAPQSWVAGLKNWRKRGVALSFAPLNVMQPAFTAVPLRFSGAKKVLTKINERRFSAAVALALGRRGRYDVVYTHFLPSGRATLRALDELEVDRPVFLNLGESDPWDYDGLYGRDGWIGGLKRFAGIAVVSTRSYEYLLSRDSSLRPRLKHLPNGVNTRLFKPANRDQCRAELGLPRSETIAIFCGHFDQRKGPLRVLEAVRRAGLRAVFLGSNGPDVPKGPEVLFAGSVSNAALPVWYNAADIFVLPSLSEGMSNAMLEAAACGLPLVVADRDFNTSFLTSACARFVDPMDPADIARGIEQCLSSSAYREMCASSVKLAQGFSLEKRARSMMSFFHQRTS